MRPNSVVPISVLLLLKPPICEAHDTNNLLLIAIGKIDDPNLVS